MQGKLVVNAEPHLFCHLPNFIFCKLVKHPWAVNVFCFFDGFEAWSVIV